MVLEKSLKSMRKLRVYSFRMSPVPLRRNLKDADSVGRLMLMNQIPYSLHVNVLVQLVSFTSIV
jgi:hypothetical protein